MKTPVGLTLGTLLALGTVAASAAGASGATPAKEPPAGIEVIVVTAKRPSAQTTAAEPIYEVIVTAKRPAYLNTNPTPPAVAPAMAIDAPKLELAVSDTVIRL